MGVHHLWFRLLHPDIGHGERADLQAAFEQAFHREEMQHMTAKAADGAFFDGDQHFVVAGELADQAVVQRLGEARIGNRGRKAGSLKIFGRKQAVREPRAEGE